MLTYTRAQELAELAAAEGGRISDVVLQDQVRALDHSAEELLQRMGRRLEVMEAAVQKGLRSAPRSASKLVGGDARRLSKRAQQTEGLLGPYALDAAAAAMAVTEVNASMGKIVAAPTAGSCGILPGALLIAQKRCQSSRDATVRALFTAGAIGLVISNRASLSGAEAGCQAECGSAACMAAAAAAELGGADPETVLHAGALALKNVLGLACDPVAGLVEIPCVKRNGFGAVHALLAADLALAGVRSAIPLDDVIVAMKQIGDTMPACIRETAEGGLAATPSGRAILRSLRSR